MANSPFHLSMDLQASSPLFKIPSELRLIILRYALTQDEAIPSTARANRCEAGYYDENCKPVKDGRVLHNELEFPPDMDMVAYRNLWYMVDDAQQHKPKSCRQILMICQRLYHEGLRFFCENRLEILWSPATTGEPSSSTGYFCDMLDGSKFYGTSPALFQIDQDELDMSTVSSTSHSQNTGGLQRYLKNPFLGHQAHRLNKLAPIVSGFTKFHLRVELLDWADESVLVMCRALRGILEGRDVTIETHDLSSYNGFEEFVLREQWLKHFRILRCKSLEILGRSELFFGCEVESLDDVVRLVTSNEPVQDIFRRWRSLCTSDFAPLPTEPCYEEFKHEILSIPADEICEYDAEEFEEWRDEAFQRLDYKGFDIERLRKMADEDSQATHPE